MSLTLHPQEVEVFYILPAIRRELSIALKELGKSQKDIAKLLGVTEAAVSQYISAKRANDVQFPSEIKASIRAAAPRIKDQASMIHEVQAILAESKQGRFICQMHEQVTDNIPKGCNVCFKG
jgi:uncharacterized protein